MIPIRRSMRPEVITQATCGAQSPKAHWETPASTEGEKGILANFKAVILIGFALWCKPYLKREMIIYIHQIRIS